MNCRQNCIVLIEDELTKTQFGNRKDEDDSYQFVLSQLAIYYNDKDEKDNSITNKEYAYIISVLEDENIPLEIAYKHIFENLRYREN